MVDVPVNGALFFVFLLAMPITFALNIGVQTLYRRAIGRVMRRSNALTGTDFVVPVERDDDGRTLEIETGASMIKAPVRWSLAMRYLLAGLVYGIAATSVLFILEGLEFSFRRFSIVSAILAAPAIPFCIYVAGCSRWLVWLGMIAWFITLALIEPETPLLAAIQVGPAAVAAMVLANRVFRTTSLTLYLIALVLIIPLLFTLDLALLLVPTFVSYALPIAALVLFGVGLIASWVMARVVAWLSGGTSDLMLQSCAVWFIMTLWQITLLFGSQGLSALWAVLPLFAYGLVFYLISFIGKTSPGSLLLFLRVFGQRKLQQEFTLGPMTNWRQDGPVMLIGAGDLATETLDTDELAAFLSGATERLFITSPDDLEHMLDRDTSAAADGLYPVLDYYCLDDTWRPCVQTLMNRATKVVLDLRGFTEDNQGVQFEIGQLVRRVSVEALTVLVDKTTDVDLASKLFFKEWLDAYGNATLKPAKLKFLKV
jgi:hypothetical protein